MADEQGTAFGREVRRLRIELGLSQESLAAEAGLTQGAIGHIETGRRKSATAEVLFAIADALKVPADHFRPFLTEAASEGEDEDERSQGKRK